MTQTAERPAAEALSRGSSTAYMGNVNFHRCLCDLLDGAEREIADYVIPEQRPDEHDRFILQGYANANRRGVQCRTLISAPHLNLVQSTWDPQFDMRTFLSKVPHIRLVERVSGPFTVTDRRKVLINLADPADPAEYTTSVVVEDAAFAEALLGRFDALWEEAGVRQEELISAWEAASTRG